MSLLENAYPMGADFPYGEGKCFVRFFINWHLTEKGAVEIASLEPQFEVNPQVWSAFLVWAESQRAGWVRQIEGIVEDELYAQHDWLMRHTA